MNAAISVAVRHITAEGHRDKFSLRAFTSSRGMPTHRATVSGAMPSASKFFASDKAFSAMPSS
ncbi:MAG: hypothetical protein MSS78_06900, partial [Bacteroidales bacterium]|nr:hypothetical protein [Bacteroidales bacterium]